MAKTVPYNVAILLTTLNNFGNFGNNTIQFMGPFNPRLIFVGKAIRLSLGWSPNKRLSPNPKYKTRLEVEGSDQCKSSINIIFILQAGGIIFSPLLTDCHKKLECFSVASLRCRQII